MSLDHGIPRLLPEGMYKIELDEEPTKELSRYGGHFFRFSSIAKNPNGEHFEFKFSLSPKMDSYHSLLRALGGQTQANGITMPPSGSVVGKKFKAKIRHRPAKNDKERMVTELVNIAPVKTETQNSLEDSPSSSGVKENEFDPF